MSSARRFQSRRRLALLFLLVTLIPVLALGWLTFELVDKDRRLGEEQVQERVDHAADRIVAASHQRLSELERQLSNLADAPSDYVVKITAEGDRITTIPSHALVYLPAIAQASAVPPAGTFTEGERYEHRDQDSRRAIAWFRTLAHGGDAAVRAGALWRLGRNQGKAGLPDDALVTFREMAGLADARVEGLPAALLALNAQCELLETMGRRTELEATARTLRAGLAGGTWPLQRDAYDLYSQLARRWSDQPDESSEERHARAVAAAYAATFQSWAADAGVPQRQWFIDDGEPILVASAGNSHRLTALVAGSQFLQDAWRGVNGIHVVLTHPGGQPILGALPAATATTRTAIRTTDATQLPWTLKVFGSKLDADRAATVRRRQLLVTGLAMILVLLGGSAYFALRGVTRELAVARLQSDFVSAVSHEFRTPLASLRHLSDMLSQGRVEQADQRQQCYDFLSKESERLERLVEELLDFGRLEGGAYHYRFESMAVADLVREVVAAFQTQVSARGYRVELSDEATNAVVQADREALSRAIWNLLDNAVKYSPGADTVWVDVAVEGRSAVIRIRDRGLGIDVSEQRDIFQKFVRGTNARAEQIKGTGIGLAMVRHIVDAHHGDVRVESQPNAGSTFTLHLPIEHAA